MQQDTSQTEQHRQQRSPRRCQGVITSFEPDLGYGFIKSADGRSVRFDVRALVNSADEEKLADGQKVSFERRPSPKGCRAAKLKLMQKPSGSDAFDPEELYLTTDHFERYQGDVRKPFKILAEASDFYIEVRDRDLQKAKLRLEDAADLIGANAMHSVKYWTTTGSEPGWGKGTHHFSEHNYSGIPCYVGCKSIKGRTAAREIPFDLNKRAHKFVLERGPEPRKPYKLFYGLALACFAIAFISFQETGRYFADFGLAGGIAGTIIFIVIAALLHPGYGTAPYSIKMKEGATVPPELAHIKR